MATAILATKVYVPQPRPGVVKRSRLIDRLNKGLAMGCKLTLISASAGFGKTTLISSWISILTSAPSPEGRKEGVRAAWLSLDEGDNDPVRFISYLITALQTIKADIGEGLLAVLHASQPQSPQVEAIFTDLLNEISVNPEHFLLIIDDYHLIDSQSVNQSLVFLVEHLPAQMHLVIATREDPALPLPRLRARGQLTELRAADLRFTPAEAAEFLNRMMGLNLSDADITALESRTEGWIAGLQLAALSMQGQSDPAKFIESFTGSNRFILDYLVEEVLGHQPVQIQNFLLHTSVLERLCGPLCEAVMETPPGSGQSTLEELERANLFLVPLDNERRWYRYHHLFGELLRQRLGQPQGFSDYHLRASVWYEANDDLARAFHHALAASDFERAARLAEMAWQGMEQSFQTAVWLGWVKTLPKEVISSSPRLCVQLGWASSDLGDLETSETYLQNAERALADMADQDESRSLPGNVALIRASNAQNRGDLAGTVKYAELSLQLIPEDDLYLRAQAAITLEFTHWTTGNLQASLRGIYAWIADMQRLGNQMFAIASAFAVADMQIILGCLGEAEQSLRQAIHQASALGREAETVTAHHHLGLAQLAYERGDEKAATEHLHSAADLGKNSTLVDWPYRWNMAQARLKESAGEWDAALELFDEAKRVYVKNPVPMLQPVEACKARIYLKQGRLDKAQAWVWERGISTETEVRYLDEFEHLTLAQVRLAEGDFTGVNDLLERLLALAETQKRTGSVLEILLTQALVHQAQGSPSQALAVLERALALAEPEGYLRIFVDEGEEMRLLILGFRTRFEKQAPHGIHRLSAYVNQLLAAFPESMAAVSQHKIANRKHSHLVPLQGSEIENRNSIIVDPLTDRELEILRLIADGQSNAEISQQLYLALSTVKGHNLRIFNKLQAQNRTEAVARARELGLL